MHDWLVPFSKPLKKYVSFPIPGGVENLRRGERYVCLTHFVVRLLTGISWISYSDEFPDGCFSAPWTSFKSVFFTAAKSSILQKLTNFIWRQKLKMQETLPTLILFYIKIKYSKMVSNTSQSHAITWNCYIVHKYWCFTLVTC